MSTQEMETVSLKNQTSLVNGYNENEYDKVFITRTITLSQLINDFQERRIIIPEIQREFVWDAKLAVKLIDSLFRGFPMPPIILHRRRIPAENGKDQNIIMYIIDGQQRITSLLSILKSVEIIDKNYRRSIIKVSYNPIKDEFSIKNRGTSDNPQWIPDISVIFDKNIGLYSFIRDYIDKNCFAPNNIQNIITTVEKRIARLFDIKKYEIAIIELQDNLRMELVGEIFSRINSGKHLVLSDFINALVASNEKLGGDQVAKAIKIFCRLFSNNSLYESLKNSNDPFVETDLFKEMTWLKDTSDIIKMKNYPKMSDVYRIIAFLSTKTGGLNEFFNNLNGIDYHTKAYNHQTLSSVYNNIKLAFSDIIKHRKWQHFSMILETAGFISPRMFRARNNLNFLFALLILESDPKRYSEQYRSPNELMSLLRKWFAISVLTTRYLVGNKDELYREDFELIKKNGLSAFIREIEESTLYEGFWTKTVVNELEVEYQASSLFAAYLAAQVRAQDRAFLSKDVKVSHLIKGSKRYGDMHHIYPKAHIKNTVRNPRDVNQVANIVIIQSEHNKQICKTSPEIYFSEILDQIAKGQIKYSDITDLDDLKKNMEENCIPTDLLEGKTLDYYEFLDKRRALMAKKIRDWYYSL